jgi:hypothetical protein
MNIVRLHTVCILFLAISSLKPSSGAGQELTKKKKHKDNLTEEYFVLNADKAIRQGQSLTTNQDIFGKKYIVEFGQYEKNMKTGKWFYFYYLDPSNFLRSSGNYLAGKREGFWRYFYPANNPKPSLTTYLGSEKRTKVTESAKGDKEFHVEIDSSEQHTQSSGEYTDDKKTGVWEYFSRSGYILHRFNHSTNTLLENNLRQPDIDFITYLGGPERFQNEYFLGSQEVRPKLTPSKSSEVIYEIDKTCEYQYIQAYGEESFRTTVNQIIKTIPNDWVFLKPDSNKKLRIIFKVDYIPDSFQRYTFSITTKAVN